MNYNSFLRKTCLLISVCLIIRSISPYDAHGANMNAFRLTVAREIPTLATGIALLYSGKYLTSHVTVPDPTTLKKRNVPVIDRFACHYSSERANRLSDFTRDVDIYLPLLTSSAILWNQEPGKIHVFLCDILLYIESVQINSGLTRIVKGAFSRSRPYAYNSSVPIEYRMEKNAALSFWSGHTAQAFNGAVFSSYVFQKRHPESHFVTPLWVLSLTLATTTAVLRVRAGEHFPTDVIASVAFGSFTGWFIPRIHEKGRDRFQILTSVRGIAGLGFRCYL